MSPDVRVAYRDAHLLVLDKPSGIPSTAPDERPSLTRIARQLDPSAPRLHPSSRLDAEVTGLVTFARTRRATEHLLRARRQHRYHRVYLGLCAATPDPPQGVWEAPIAIDPRDKRKRMAGPGAGAKTAQTGYCVSAVAAHGVLLKLEPQTGRTHQLRVHAMAAGVPLLGDRPYGGEPRVVLPDGRVLRAARVMLHCAALELPAIEGGALRISAPAHADMAALWQALGGDPLALSAGA